MDTYDEGIQSRAEVRAIFLNVDKPLAEKSPRPGQSRVAAIHQNTRGLPSFEGCKAPLKQTRESPPLAPQTTPLPALLCITNNHSATMV